jgi:hypothetical protein
MRRANPRWRDVGVLRTINAVPMRTRYGLGGILLLALAFILVIALDHPGPRQPHRTFTDREIEAARLRILPLRQSGTIYKWHDEGRRVFVTRAAWESLSDAAKRETCQAMATARAEQRLVVLDEKGGVIGVCAATGQFTVIASGVIPEWGRDYRTEPGGGSPWD